MGKLEISWAGYDLEVAADGDKKDMLTNGQARAHADIKLCLWDGAWPLPNDAYGVNEVWETDAEINYEKK